MKGKLYYNPRDLIIEDISMKITIPKGELGVFIRQSESGNRFSLTKMIPHPNIDIDYNVFTYNYDNNGYLCDYDIDCECDCGEYEEYGECECDVSPYCQCKYEHELILYTMCILNNNHMLYNLEHDSIHFWNTLEAILNTYTYDNAWGWANNVILDRKDKLQKINHNIRYNKYNLYNLRTLYDSLAYKYIYDEFIYEKKHINIDDTNENNDSILQNITMIGLGSVGSNILYQLGKLSHTNNFQLIDFDIIEDKNTRNQLYTHGVVGREKTRVCASYLKQMKKNVRYTNKTFEDMQFKLDNNIVISCVDNIPTRYEIFNKSISCAKYLIDISVSEDHKTCNILIIDLYDIEHLIYYKKWLNLCNNITYDDNSEGCLAQNIIAIYPYLSSIITKSLLDYNEKKCFNFVHLSANIDTLQTYIVKS